MKFYKNILIVLMLITLCSGQFALPSFQAVANAVWTDEVVEAYAAAQAAAAPAEEAPAE